MTSDFNRRTFLQAIGAGTAATAAPALLTACATARMCASVVPQQPPTPFTRPLSANSRRNAAVWSGVSS